MEGSNLMRRTLVCLLTLVLLTVTAPAAAAPGAEDVYRTLKLDGVPAQYVVLVDTSSSMREGNMYGAVRTALREYLAALSPTDQLALITFDSTPKVVFNDTVGQDPDAVLSRLPAVPTGVKTDIGRALQECLAILQGSRDAVGNVLMFTDGQHDPPPGSAYPYAQGASWEKLRYDAAGLPMPLTGFSVPLRPGAGVGALKTIVPGAQDLSITPATIGELARQLEVPKRAGRAEKAKSILKSDATASVRARWHSPATIRPGRTKVTLTLHSNAVWVPLTVTDLVVDSSETSVKVEVPGGPFTVAPRGSWPVDVFVTWDPGASGPSERVTAGLTARGTVDSAWSPALRQDIGMTFTPGFAADREVVTGTVPIAAGWWVALAVAVGLAVLAVWIVLRRRRAALPVLSGTLRASAPFGNEVHGAMSLSGRQVPLDTGKLGIAGSGTLTAVRTDDGVAVRIGYSPDAGPERLATVDCPADGSVILNGVTFSWLDAAPGRRPAVPAGASDVP
jgi:hypothetical protein